MRILITGATGLIGKKITDLCHQKGIEVNYLTHSRGKIQKLDDYRGFYWNPMSGEIDERCFEGIQTIIHLAGANIFQPWTKKNKEIITKSRTESADLLFRTLQEGRHDHVLQFISASGINIYPSSYEKYYREDEKKVSDSFLGEVVVKWEAVADRFADLGLKVAKVRTGMVLSDEGGALSQMKKPVKLNLGAPLGTGRQWQSWIHIADIAGIYLHLMESGLAGTYNAVAPNPVTNREMTEKLANNMGKKVWLPNIPASVLRTTLGEMAQLVLDSQRVSSEKIENDGFYFRYVNVESAFQDLLK